MKKIVFLGASTAYHEVHEIIRAININEPTYEIVAILDDDKSKHGSVLRGITVSGYLDDVKNFPDCEFVLGIGSMQTRLIREEIFKRLNLSSSRFATIIHPSAIIDHTATIGNGCIIHPGVVIGNDVLIDDFVIIAVNSAIGPYSQIKSFAMITSLVLILSKVSIGKSTFVGSCTCITETIQVGSGCMIGVGTIVSRNLDNGVFVLGNPMRQLSKININID